MAGEFKPSIASMGSEDRALAQLAYLSKVAPLLEAHMRKHPGELPEWLLGQIDQSATALSMVVGYLSKREKK